MSHVIVKGKTASNKMLEVISIFWRDVEIF